MMATTPTRATENVAASGDPYYVFKDELESKVSSVHQKYVKWKSVFDAKDSVAMKELPALTTQITTAIASAEKSVKFLEQTIVMVEANRTKFEHIDNNEIASRKAFVSSTRMEILAVSTEVTSDEAKARIKKVEQKALKPLVPTPSSNPSHYEDHNARFLAEETARQNDIMRDQDKNIDTLHKTVGRLNDVAVTINDEVKTQNGMLKDLSNEVDTAQEQMNFVMDKMSKLLKTKDKCQLGLIVFLSFVLAVMLFLVIYT